MKVDGGKGGGASRRRRSSSSFDKPSWLLFAVADMEEKMKTVVTGEEEDKADTFAERAEAYYQKRPQLLALLHDLFNRYLLLANRYSQTIPKQKQQPCDHQSPISLSLSLTRGGGDSDVDEQQKEEANIDYSDAESSLSYQLLPFPNYVNNDRDAADKIIVELVMKNVEYDIMVEDHTTQVEDRNKESTRRIELQRSLLEVLESERLILLNENARLGYRVNALVEENKGLGRECLFMKRKAGEMARCMLKMREEDHRVCMMSRRIEHLQGQIHGLERRNKEYYEKLVEHENVKRLRLSMSMNMKKSSSPCVGLATTLEDCLQDDDQERGVCVGNGGRLGKVIKGGKSNFTTHVVGQGQGQGQGQGGRGKTKVFKLWDRVKNFDMFMCGPHVNAS